VLRLCLISTCYNRNPSITLTLAVGPLTLTLPLIYGAFFVVPCRPVARIVKTKRQTGRAPHPLPLPSRPLPSPPLPSPPLPFAVGPLNPARGSGERCKLPLRGLGRNPSRNRFWCILALKSGIRWQQF